MLSIGCFVWDFRLEDLYENVVMETQAERVTPLVINPGRLLLTSMRLYFQPFNNIGPVSTAPSLLNFSNNSNFSCLSWKSSCRPSGESSNDDSCCGMWYDPFFLTFYDDLIIQFINYAIRAWRFFAAMTASISPALIFILPSQTRTPEMNSSTESWTRKVWKTLLFTSIPNPCTHEKGYQCSMQLCSFIWLDYYASV